MKKVSSKPAWDFAVGRRKTAVARARIYPSSADVVIGGKKLERGETYVNGVTIDQYFRDPYSKERYTELFRTTNTVGRFIITVVTEGSGISGQLGATTLAIARALCKIDPKFRAILRKKDYLTRDPRMRERKKPGLPGARKKKSSPKR
jgi:small subunit ribosomal protein S9